MRKRALSLAVVTAVVVAAIGLVIFAVQMRHRTDAFGQSGPWAFVFYCGGHFSVDMGTGERMQEPLAARDPKLKPPASSLFLNGGCAINSVTFDWSTNRVAYLVPLTTAGAISKEEKLIVSMLLPNAAQLSSTTLKVNDELPSMLLRPRHNELWVNNGRPMDEKDYLLTLDVYDATTLKSKWSDREVIDAKEWRLARLRPRLAFIGSYFSDDGNTIYTFPGWFQRAHGSDVGSQQRPEKAEWRVHSWLKDKLIQYTTTDKYSGLEYIPTGTVQTTRDVALKGSSSDKDSTIYTVNVETQKVAALINGVWINPFVTQLTPDATRILLQDIDKPRDNRLDTRLEGRGSVRLFDRLTGAVVAEMNHSLFDGEAGSFVCMVADGTRFLYLGPKGSFLVDLITHQVKQVGEPMSGRGSVCVMPGQPVRAIPSSRSS